MDRRTFLASAVGTLGGLTAVPSLLTARPARDDKMQAAVESSVERGLEYLKRTQAADGYWESPGGTYLTSMTALAGMAFLMEGSTLREGKYREQISKAMEWLIQPRRVRGNGLIGNVDNVNEQQRYMYGHGFGTMFLACLLGEEEDNKQRARLESIVKKACEFIGKAQSEKKHTRSDGTKQDIGGWYYTSKEDGGNLDEGSVTITQLQALRAAKNAGIPVSIDIITKANAYLEACTTAQGGVLYQYGQAGNERAPLTAAALACAISSGDFATAITIMNRKDPPPPTGINRPNVVRWLEYCRRNIPIAKGRVAHEEYQMYYYSQAMYMLGDDRFGLLFPNDPKESWLTWSKYKEAFFPYIMDTQDKSTGGWMGTGSYGCGPVFITSVNLCTLQLEKAILPIYQR